MVVMTTFLLTVHAYRTPEVLPTAIHAHSRSFRCDVIPYIAPPSPSGPPAVHKERVTRDHSGRRAGEIRGSSRDLLDFSHAAQGYAREDALTPLRIGEGVPTHLSRNKGRRHRVHGYPVLGQLEREHLRQNDHAALA